MHSAELFQLRQPIHVSHQNVAQLLCSALQVLYMDAWIESGLAVYVWLVIGVNPTETESLFEKKLACLVPLLIGLALPNALFLICYKTGPT